MSQTTISTGEQLRVVIDAVGFVRSLINPRSAWGAVVFEFADDYLLVVSDAIEAEILDVIERPDITRRFDALSDALKAMLPAMLALADRVTLGEIPKVCRDPNDDKVLATAIAGSANFIATQDNDLLDMGEYQGVRIVTGVELLSILRR